MKLNTLAVTALALSSLLMTSPMVVHAIKDENRVASLSEKLFPSYANEFAQAINMAQLEYNVSYKISGTDVNDKCVALMNGNMIAGEIGRGISQVFINNANRLPLLVHGGSVNTKYCRQYSKMTDKEKSMVWVFILTAMAHFESSCNKTVAAKGPNGTAYGYYQLHKGHEDKYDGNTGLCQKGDAGKPLAASKCTLAMLERQFDRDTGELFSRRSYWDVLRPQGESQKAAVIRRALQRSSLCNPVAI